MGKKFLQVGKIWVTGDDSPHTFWVTHDVVFSRSVVDVTQILFKHIFSTEHSKLFFAYIIFISNNN